MNISENTCSYKINIFVNLSKNTSKYTKDTEF